MNQAFKNIDIEQVLFFDSETVRNSKELDINSKEFDLYQKKIRNRETDELQTSEETIEHYKKFAALKLGYNRVVCVTVGKVVEGNLYLRSFTGDEEDILKGLFEKFQTSKIICGFNLSFDLPVVRVNSLRYGNYLSEMIPEGFQDSLKKSWHLEKSVVDLMDAYRGIHWGNPSLDEVCHQLGIESPKTDLDGSQVSETYYNEGVGRIEKYAKSDVLATVNVFCRLQGKALFESYIDANEAEGGMPQEEPLPILTKLYNTKQLNKEELISYLKERGLKKSTPKKEKEELKKIVLAHWLERIDVMDFDEVKKEKTATNEKRTAEINELINSI